MVLIESAHNSHIKLYKSLEKRKYRDDLHLVPLEGVRFVCDALAQGALPELILIRAGTDENLLPFLHSLPVRTPIFTVSGPLFDKTAFTESPQGVLAVVRKPAASLPEVFRRQPAFILVVDGVQDPGNLGTMLRSAAAAGAGGVVLLPGTVDAANPKALRASMGAYFAVPVVETTAMELRRELEERQVRLVVTAAEASVCYDRFDWNGPVAVAIGNEGAGVSEEVRKAADAAVSIPIASAVESLNAAIAMSVIFFEASRQRRLSGLNN